MAINKSRLAEIYKSEKSKGGGLTTTLGKRALEKFDPRQMFNQSGFAAAVLPSLFKSYSAIKKPDKIVPQAPQASSPVRPRGHEACQPLRQQTRTGLP